MNSKLIAALTVFPVDGNRRRTTNEGVTTDNRSTESRQIRLIEHTIADKVSTANGQHRLGLILFNKFRSRTMPTTALKYFQYKRGF